MLGLIASTPMAFSQDDQQPTKEATATESTKDTTATTEETTEAEPDEKAIKKEARRYWQVKTARMKKGVSILKKIKNEKTAKKAVKSLEKLTKTELKKPESNEFTDAVEQAFAPQVEKYTEQLEDHIERLKKQDESNKTFNPDADKLVSDELTNAVNKLK